MFQKPVYQLLGNLPAVMGKAEAGDLALALAERKDEFADDGAGMSRETSEKIFQPLFTTKERGRGTGLGLFVVSRILDKHAAEISVESATEKGTKIKLFFRAV